MIVKSSITRLSNRISHWAGSPTAFVFAVIGVFVWLVTGPYFGFSELWLITITAITDVIIFVMVFSIQNAQNRDSKAIQLKLNELIAADRKARDAFIGLESLTDTELSQLDAEFQELLAKLEAAPPGIHKLHKSIKQEKAKRPGFYQQAEHLVAAMLGPLSGSPDKSKNHRS